MRLTADQLRDKALLALEDAVQESRYRAPRRSFAIRFALAYLWNVSRCGREPFDDFWTALGPCAGPASTLGRANTALLRIYLALGMERPKDVDMDMWRRWTKEQGHGGGKPN